MKKHFRRLKHFLVPHKGNKYKPGVLARESIGVLVLVLFVIEGAYVVDNSVLLKNAGFTASVLPAALTTLTNTDRDSQGLPSVERDPALDAVAQAKADDMAAKGYFAHVSPSGKTPWDWLDQFNYPYTYAGENLAVDFDESSDVETAWMNSPAHRANILKAEYQYVGFGVAQGTYEGHTTTFVAEFFAAKPAAGNSAPEATAKPTPAQTAAVAAVPATETATIIKPAVLGAETSPPAPLPAAAAITPGLPNFLASLLASPRQLVFDIVLGMTGFIGIILVLSLFFHIRKRYLHVELIVGGVILLAVGYGFMALNEGTVSAVNLPHDTQSASAAAAL